MSMPVDQDRVRTHTVKLMKGVVFDTPQLWMDVYIEGDRSEERAFSQWLVQASCHKAHSPDVADLVIFTGGDDVNPALYGAERHAQTFIDSARDAREIELYHYCLEQGIPMMGVCRGAQFLHVMEGGILYQDVDGHNGKHGMRDLEKKVSVNPVSSVHHQMCRLNRNGKQLVLADSLQSTKRWLDNETLEEGRISDIEAYFYRDSCIFGVQGHPEYRGYAAYSHWCLEKMDELLLSNPDLELVGNYRRIKRDLLEERKLMRMNNEAPEPIDAEID